MSNGGSCNKCRWASAVNEYSVDNCPKSSICTDHNDENTGWEPRACGFCRRSEIVSYYQGCKEKKRICNKHITEIHTFTEEGLKKYVPKDCTHFSNRPAEKPKEVEKKCETCNNNHNKTSRCYASEDPAIECLLRDYILWHPKGVRDWGYEKYVHVSDSHSSDIITLEGVWFKNKAIVDQIYNSFYEQEEIELPYTGEGKIRGTIINIDELEKVHTRWYCKKIKLILKEWQPKEEPKPKGITNCDECIHGFKLNKGLHITCPSRDMDVPNCGKEARYFEAKSCGNCNINADRTLELCPDNCSKKENLQYWRPIVEPKAPTAEEESICKKCKIEPTCVKKNDCFYDSCMWFESKEPNPDPVRDCETCTHPCDDIPQSKRKGINGKKGCNNLTNLYMYEAKSCESCKYLKGGIGNRPCGECNKNRDKWEAKEPTETTLCEICKYKCKYAKKTKCEYFTDENLCKECIRKKCRDCFGGIHFEPKEPRTCKECEQCSMYDMIKKRCRYDYKKIYDSCPKSKKVVLCRNCKYYDWNESKNYWNSCLCTKLTKYTTDFSKGCEGFKPREKTVEKHTCSICKHHSTHFRKCIHGQAGIFRSIDHEDVKECRFLVVKETTVEVNQEFVFSTPHQSEMWEIMKEQLDLQKKELKQQKEMYKEMANTVPTRYWTGQRVKLVNNNKANKVEIIGGIEPMEDIKKEIERVKEEYKKEQERTKKIEDTRKEFIKTVIIAEDMDLLKKLKDQRYFLKEELLTFLDLKKKERKIAKTFYYYSYNNIDGEMRRGYLVRDDTDGTYLYALDDRKEWDTVKKILQEIKDKKDLWRLSLEQDKLYDLVERNCRRAKCPDIYKEEKEDVCDCKKYIRKKSVFCPRCGLPICPNCRETLEMGEFECKICGWVK